MAEVAVANTDACSAKDEASCAASTGCVWCNSDTAPAACFFGERARRSAYRGVLCIWREVAGRAVLGRDGAGTEAQQGPPSTLLHMPLLLCPNSSCNFKHTLRNRCRCACRARCRFPSGLFQCRFPEEEA